LKLKKSKFEELAKDVGILKRKSKLWQINQTWMIKIVILLMRCCPTLKSVKVFLFYF